MDIIEPWLVGKVMGSVVPTIGRPIHPHTVPFFPFIFQSQLQTLGHNEGCTVEFVGGQSWLRSKQESSSRHFEEVG